MLLLTAFASTAAAQGTTQGTGGFFVPVPAGDPDVGLNIQTTLVSVGFVDANGNDALDVVEPDESAYLDLDGSHTVTFADLRLTPFATYPAGSSVDYTNRDFARTLTTAHGWFARDARSAWFLDTDANAKLSPGDVRLTGPGAGTKVKSGDADFGQPLTKVQDSATPGIRIAWNDRNGNQHRDPLEAVYLDLNFDRQVTPGEPRVQATGLGLDNQPTRAEFDGAVNRLDQRDAGFAATDAQQDQQLSGLNAQLATLGQQITSLGQQILLVGILALVGFLGLGYWVHRVDKRTAPSPGASPPSSGTEARRPS